MSRLGTGGQVFEGVIVTFGTGILVAAALLWLVQFLLPTPLQGIWRAAFVLTVFLIAARKLGFALFKKLLREVDGR